jgi:hypothetical protein
MRVVSRRSLRSLLNHRAGLIPAETHTKWRTAVSKHEIGICGNRVRQLRLDLVITAATSQFLVARRHVDLGRTRSMVCMSV